MVADLGAGDGDRAGAVVARGDDLERIWSRPGRADRRAVQHEQVVRTKYRVAHDAEAPAVQPEQDLVAQVGEGIAGHRELLLLEDETLGGTEQRRGAGAGRAGGAGDDLMFLWEDPGHQQTPVACVWRRRG